METAIIVSLEKLSRFANLMLVLLVPLFFFLGLFVAFWWHFGTVFLILLNILNFFYIHIQKKHAILKNFGILGQMRYILESVGPEFRQYFFLSDTEERPFSREERSEVYRKSKNIDSSSAFGSQKDFNENEIKIRHSMYPTNKNEIQNYKLTFGEERGIKNTYSIDKPFLISAMSFGALGQNAVRALSRGAKKAGIPMNTGEGGYPKYHLMEGADIIFQMGTAKFGVRNLDGTLNDKKLKELSEKKQIKMIEIKFSQGAKPGKGGLLPKEKITKEISKLRVVPMNEDVISPSNHSECDTPKNTVKFIKRVQDISKLPVGIKLCLGNPDEFRELIREMKKQNSFPDYISIDGGEGGTGAAPKGFMDDVGIKIFDALPIVHEILIQEKVRNKFKILAAGKLINPGKQLIAMCLGADAIYTARGFMLALGCIQALQCNKNSCPVGITTHDKKLQKGLDIEVKSERVKNYVNNLNHDFYELLTATGAKKVDDLSHKNIYIPKYNIDLNKFKIGRKVV